MATIKGSGLTPEIEPNHHGSMSRAPPDGKKIQGAGVVLTNDAETHVRVCSDENLTIAHSLGGHRVAQG